jgi:hypothetical protein
MPSKGNLDTTRDFPAAKLLAVEGALLARHRSGLVNCFDGDGPLRYPVT